MGNGVEGLYEPQQFPVAAPAGWVPAVGGVLNLVGVFDTRRRTWVGLPLDALTEALVAAERLHAEDRIDARNGQADVTIPDASDEGTVRTQEIEVPAGEVWFINRFNLVTEDEVTGNIRISRFPKVDDVDKRYLQTNQAAGEDVNYDLADPGELGTELRLVGGDKVTVVGTADALTTADRDVTLTLFGRKARRLVE